MLLRNKIFRFFDTDEQPSPQKDYSTLGNEEITAELDKLDSDEPVEAPEGQAPETDNSKQEPENNEQQPEKKEPEAQAKTPDEQPEKKAPEAPVTAPDKDKAIDADKAMVLTEEMFNRLPEEDQKRYAKFKGKSVGDILTSYHNLETFVGKKQDELKKELFTPKPEQPKKPEEIVEAQKIKEQLIMNDLRSQFPNLELPANLDDNSPEFKEFLSDLNIADRPTAKKFEKALDEISATVDQDLKQVEHFRTNYVDINNSILDGALNQFDDYYKKNLG